MKIATLFLASIFLLSNSTFAEEIEVKDYSNAKKRIIKFKTSFKKNLPQYEKILEGGSEIKIQLAHQLLVEQFEDVEKLEGYNKSVDALITKWLVYAESLQEIISNSEDINFSLDQAIKSIK
ncbi:MAG: hypothetical protein L6Q54_04710 [Leptospiraceae bacterium]|nr:hypothetical protein [Leptospiraceae bacterium]